MDKQLVRKRGSWGKRLLFVFATLAILLIAVYFVATSSFFLKSVILPRAGAALNADITVEDASISPFSQVHLTKLQVKTTGTEPLLTAEEVRLRYSLMDIIKGNINVDEVTISSPVVQIVQEADGSSNLDPLLKKDDKADDEKPRSDEPTRLDVKNIALKNGTVRQIVKSKDGGVSRTELQNLNITLDRLANGQSGKLTLASALSMSDQQGGTNNVLKADLSGGYDIALTQDLLPQSAKGSLKINVNTAEGSYAQAAGLGTSLDADLTPTEIKDLGVRFAKGTQELGRLRVSGPFDATKMEGNLKIELIGIDKNLLNVASPEYDFKNSRLNFVSQVALSQGANFIAANGSLMGRQISLTQKDLVTPEMDLNVEYQVTVNLAEKTAVLQKLNIGGTQRQKEFLRASLDRQMNLSWGTAVKGYKDASLQLVVTNFNVADWRAVVGTNLSSGIVNVQMALASQQDGKLLNTDVAGTVNNFAAQFGTNRIAQAAVTFAAKGSVEEMKVINITSYNFALQQANAPVIQANGAARYALETKDVSAQLTADAALPKLLALASVPDLSARTGTLKVSATYSDAGGKQKAHGQLGLEEFTGTLQVYQMENFRMGVEYNVGIENELLDIQRAAVTFAQGFTPGGSVDVTGKYHLTNNSGKITYKIVNLNENTFRPFLAPSLGDKKLVSISLNGSGEANLDPKGENAIKTDLKIANWRVEDPAGKLPKEPLSVDLNLDGGMREQTLNLRQLLVQLTPTERAKNALQLQAKIDMATNNPSPSTLTIASESFDVTPYYNMFAGAPATNAASPSPTGGATTPPPPAEGEPAPMTLPFQQFTANLKFDRFYLNQIAISNWTGTIAIRTNNILINPFQLTLNGAPVNVNGQVDVGVPGYRYDLAFRADGVPVEPVLNSISDTNAQGQIKGTLFADAKIRGLGTTGTNLQKNLGGNASFSITNMDYQILSPKMKRIVTPVAAITRTPELLQTPINWVSGVTVISNGVVQLQKLGVESEAFYADVHGTITLAPVLTNSVLNLPIDLSLRRSLAEKAGMLATDTPTNAKYAKLPRFYTIKGTIGDPQPDEDEVAIASQLLKSAGALGVGNKDVEKALGAIGEIGTKFSQGGTNNAGGTNQNIGQALGGALKGILGSQPDNTATNKSAATNTAPNEGVAGALRGLLGGGQTSTNNTATNAPAANPLDGLFRRRENKK